MEWNEDGTVGGSHQLLFDLARALDKARFEPVALFYQPNRFCARLEAQGIEVHLYDEVRRHERRVREDGRRLEKYADFLGAIARRAKLLRELRVDLVHLINAPWRGVDDWLPACRATGIPCVATAGTLNRATRAPLHRFLVRKYDRILAVSQSVAEGLRRVGISSNVQVVYPGVDVGLFRDEVRRSREEVRSELGIPPEATLVTMVGHIRRWKGQHVALEAMARLPGDVRRGFRLLIVGASSHGEQEYCDGIKERAREADLASIVTVLGERQDVAELFSASDFALHASLRPEPFGLVLVEALAVGTPVIAADRGGPTEILTPDCGFLFDPEDPNALASLLCALSRDPDRFVRMSEAARARAQQFTVERMRTGVQSVYESVLRSKRLPESEA